jgi:Zn-dependent alcohol dehydrogenase
MSVKQFLASRGLLLVNLPSWKTTWLGCSKYLFFALSVLMAQAGISVDPNTHIVRISADSPTKINVLLGCYVICGILQAIATQDTKPSPPPLDNGEGK